jgi:nicotinamide mononucleotide transporter
VFGLLCVWLTTRQSIWCWPTGLVSVTLYVFVFYGSKLYSDVILQLIYIPLQVYGWWHWKYGRKDREPLPVVRLTPVAAGMWLAVCAAGTAAWGYFMATYTDAALPYWDAWIVVASLVAQYLMTRKVLENWPLWMAVDVVAVGVYWVKGLYPTAILYVVYFVLCVLGLVSWWKSYRARPTA